MLLPDWQDFINSVESGGETTRHSDLPKGLRAPFPISHRERWPNSFDRPKSLTICRRTFQITEEVYDVIADDPSFVVEPRGEIFVKGKGTLNTYFLQSKYDWAVAEREKKVEIVV